MNGYKMIIARYKEDVSWSEKYNSILGGGRTPTFSEGKSLVAKRASGSERDCDQTSLG